MARCSEFLVPNERHQRISKLLRKLKALTMNPHCRKLRVLYLILVFVIVCYLIQLHCQTEQVSHFLERWSHRNFTSKQLLAKNKSISELLDSINLNDKEIYSQLTIDGYKVSYDTNNSDVISSNNNNNTDASKLNLSHDKWERMVPGIRLANQIYSAYFDERMDVIPDGGCPIGFICPGLIRVITVGHKTMNTTKFYCHFKYQNGDVRKDSAHHVEQIIDSMPYKTFILSCLLLNPVLEELRFPKGVGVSCGTAEVPANKTTFVKIRYPRAFDSTVSASGPQDKVAICVPAFWKYKNALRIVEFIELYRLIGVTRFYFYNTSFNENVERVLNYYVRTGNVTVLDWHLIDSDKIVTFYDGISACYHDCYYRASFVDNIRYTALHDIDEIIIPRVENVTLLDLLHRIDNETFNSFSLRNVFMKIPKFYKNPTDPVSKNFVNKFLYTQEYTVQSQVWPPRSRAKLIAKSKHLFYISNHIYLKAINNTTDRIVEPTEALLYHYRYPILQNATFPVWDSSLRRFSLKLHEAVDKVCQLNFHDGVCPID